MDSSSTVVKLCCTFKSRHFSQEDIVLQIKVNSVKGTTIDPTKNISVNHSLENHCCKSVKIMRNGIMTIPFH